MKPSELVQKRYTAKVFDPSKKIAAADIDELKALLQYAPSSTNLQPWHFVIAGTEEGKARVAKAMQGNFIFNEAKVLGASHVVVLCSKVSLDESYLQDVLKQEEIDGRFPTASLKEQVHAARGWFANLHQSELKDLPHWLDKQVYLALGTLLYGAATLGIDACAMEGFDACELDKELELHSQGLAARVVVALGYHSSEDFNCNLPKSRFPRSQVISEI